MISHTDLDKEIARIKDVGYVVLFWNDGFTLHYLDTTDRLPFWSDGDVYDLFWELPKAQREWLWHNGREQKALFEDGTPLMGYDHNKVIERWLQWKRGELPIMVKLNKEGKYEAL